MNRRELSLPAANLALRAAALSGRFALTIFLAKYLDFEAVGAFGLLAGLAGMTPAIIGFGVNYFLAREIVGAGPLRAGRLLRDRLVITVTMLLLYSSAFAALSIIGVLNFPYVGLTLLIVSLECLSFDIHMNLISLRMPLAANALLFIRSSSWIFPAILIGVLDTHFRTLHFILICWAFGLLANFAALAVVFRKWPVTQILKSAVDTQWIRSKLRGGWYIYLNDVGIAGQLYLDRFVVNHFLGLRLTGIYTLYWTMANAVTVLVSSGVTQLALPHLVLAFREGDDSWRKVFSFEVLKVAGVAVLLCAGVAAAVFGLLPRFGVGQFLASPWLFLLMLCAVVLKSVSDMFSYGLYSRHRDRAVASVNVAGIIISTCASATFVTILGLIGAGVGMICTAALLLAVRIWSLRKELRWRSLVTAALYGR